MQINTFKISIGKDHFEVPKKLSEVSLYFHNILSLGVDEEQIEIDPCIVEKQSFVSFLNFWEINEFKEPQIPKKIRTNNVEDVLDKKNYEFIKEFGLESEKLMKLINTASFLVSKGLKQVIATLYACKIYFQDTKRAYQEKKKELGIPENTDITFEDEEKFRQEYYMSSSIADV